MIEDTYFWQTHALWHCGSQGTLGMGTGKRGCTLWSKADLLERERKKSVQKIDENIILKANKHSWQLEDITYKYHIVMKQTR